MVDSVRNNREGASIGSYPLLGYLPYGNLVQLSPPRRVDTFRLAHGWDQPQPILPEDLALTLQAISFYQAAAEAFASGKMQAPKPIPVAPILVKPPVPNQESEK